MVIHNKFSLTSPARDERAGLKAMERRVLMDTYLCQYLLPNHDLPQGTYYYFKCQADDESHAVEQLLDAEPKAYDLFCEIYERGGKDD